MHDLPVTSLDALTTELWVTHAVSRSQAWGCKSQDFASHQYTGHSIKTREMRSPETYNPTNKPVTCSPHESPMAQWLEHPDQ